MNIRFKADDLRTDARFRLADLIFELSNGLHTAAEHTEKLAIRISPYAVDNETPEQT